MGKGTSRVVLAAMVALGTAWLAPSALADLATPALPVAPAIVPAAPSVPVIPAVPALPARPALPSGSVTVSASVTTPSTTPVAKVATKVHRIVKPVAHTVRAKTPKPVAHAVGKVHKKARPIAATMNCPVGGAGSAVHCVNVPTGGELPDQCNATTVTIFGTVNFTITVQANLDLTMTITTRENFQNVTGVGADGSEYQANDKDTTQTQIAPIGDTVIVLDQELELITIKPAQKPNELYHVRDYVRISIDPLTGLPVVGDQLDPAFVHCTG